ncbi:tyrosine-protein phosphatase (plasmid) [Sphingomonas bisphenolicum]
MTALPIDRRHFLSGALLTSFAALAGCTTPVARGTSAAIPFRAANVMRIADSDDYHVEWQAEDVRRIAIYVSDMPSPMLVGQPVAQGNGTGSATIRGLTPGSRSYFTLVPDRGAPLVVADRALHISGIANLRDIGGYRTTDGRWVKMGMLYRSDQLDRVSDADMAALERLGLRVVVDLRTQSERMREPDRLPPGSRPLILDVAADGDGSLGGDMRKATAAIAAGKGVELLTAANRDFVALGSARQAYAALLRELATPQAIPLLYHCTAGKDRTGWATAIVLTLLGVPRDTVMADYMASNRYLERKNAKTVSALAQSGSTIDPTSLMPVLTVRTAYLQAAFDEVEKRHGSFDAYLRNGLGMNDHILNNLRKTYLC